MKKIIAISVMFALVAGAVFADVSMGGEFGYQMDVLKGTNGKIYPKSGSSYVGDPSDKNGEKVLGYAAPVSSGTNFKVAKVDFDFSGDNYGGRVRLYANPSKGWWTGEPFAFAWWKPVDLFKFQLGLNPDGNFGTVKITGWGFNASAQDYAAVDNGDAGKKFVVLSWDDEGELVFVEEGRDRAWKAARAYGFYGGFSDVGALLSFYPVDILTVNIALPVGNGKASGYVETADMFKKAHLNVVAKVGDIGEASLSFEGKGGVTTSKDFNDDGDGFVSSKSYNSTGDIWASFYLTAVENLGLDVGFGYHLPYDTPGTGLSTTKTNDGVEIGIGATYKVSDDFGVKARIGAKLLTEEKTVYLGGYSSATQTNYGIGILPYYNLGGPTVYFNAGFGVDSYTSKSVSAAFPEFNNSTSVSYTDWYVNPYVKVPAGGLTFWAGFKVLGDTMIGHSTKTAYQNGGTMEWALPIGISVGF